ncbi:glycoside hydrolase superfamily [Blakeslea trispora]|nr:glycoside hydrolase superfamily [Blakeslea trispora]
MEFVKVKGTKFYLHDKVYPIKSANYWQGMNLGASEDQGGDKARLRKELDQMKAMGINNLRVMASSEGPDDQPYRMRPSLQISPGVYNQAIFKGLDYLLDQMGQRNMTAVMTLNNFWQWSGGFGQYVAWVTQEKIPYPVKDYDPFVKFCKRFYDDPVVRDKVKALYYAHIRKVQTRTNTYNQKVYNKDPVIMSWQIANEPQLGPKDWYIETARFIKEGAPHQLVSAGIESKEDQKDFNNAHDNKYVDYCTCHCWVENWGKYNASEPTGASLKNAKQFAIDFIKTRGNWSREINKPIIMEEFGMARDAWRNPQDPDYKYLPSTPTTHKDDYYATIFKQIEQSPVFAGDGFWAYSGLGRSTDTANAFNMTWLGDPPHEPKGWYGVYNIDTTVQVIQNHFMQLDQRI